MRNRDIGQIVAAIAGLGCIGAALYVASWLFGHLVSAVMSGNLVAVIGWSIVLYLGGLAVIVILFAAGIFLIIAAIDN